MEQFLMTHGQELVIKSWEHISISAISLLLGVVVAVPLGIALTRTDKLANFVIGFASLLQTIPSLALLALMVPIFGGWEVASDYCVIYLFAIADFT